MVKLEIRYNYNLDIARSIIRRACIYRYLRSVLFLLRDVVFQGHFQLLSVLLCCCCSLFLRKRCRKLTLKAVRQQGSISPTYWQKEFCAFSFTNTVANFTSKHNFDRLWFTPKFVALHQEGATYGPPVTSGPRRLIF